MRRTRSWPGPAGRRCVSTWPVVGQLFSTSTGSRSMGQGRASLKARACSPQARMWQTSPKGPMNDVIDSEGFRANVGIVLMRGSGEVFLGRRMGGRGWQFPQGGMRRDESLEEAMLRELHEEV